MLGVWVLIHGSAILHFLVSKLVGKQSHVVGTESNDWMLDCWPGWFESIQLRFDARRQQLIKAIELMRGLTGASLHGLAEKCRELRLLKQFSTAKYSTERAWRKLMCLRGRRLTQICTAKNRYWHCFLRLKIEGRI